MAYIKVDAYLGLFPSYDYVYARVPVGSINPTEKTITLKHGASFGIMNAQSRRWKIFNLLEEVDTPGEWYIDKEKLILYYYPPYGLKNATMEVATMRRDLFILKNVSYVNFEGLSFTQTLGAVFHTKPYCENIKISYCNFEYLDNCAIKTDSYASSSLIKETINGGIGYGGGGNITIENNYFSFIGVSAIGVGGIGKHSIDEGIFSDESSIRNNYIEHVGYMSPGQFANNVGSAAKGVVIENNMIVDTASAAMGYGGIGLKIQKNEIRQTNTVTVDGGSIYCGRSAVMRGHEIAYNIIAGSNPPKDEKLYKFVHNRAIYWDDALAGQWAHHNIIVDAEKANTSGGNHDIFENNTIVDSKAGMYIYIKEGQGQDAIKQRYTDVISAASGTKGFEEYVKEFPEFLIEAQGTEGISRFMKTNNNLLVNSAQFKTPTGYEEYNNEAIGNMNISSVDDFVDPSSFDYRLKKDSEILKQNPNLLSEDYDITQIGLNIEEFGAERITSKKKFRQLYPQNLATGIETTNVTFQWEECQMANEYRFVLAKDRELKDVVLDTVTVRGFIEVDKLDSNCTDYYWKVYAINSTRSLKDSWPANGTTYHFTTAKYDSLDKAVVEDLVEQMLQMEENVVEGTDAGTFKTGTKEKFFTLLSEANGALKWRIGTKSQQDIDNLVIKYNDILSENNVNSGFYNLGKCISKENWIIPIKSLEGVEFQDDGIKFKSEETGFAQIENHSFKYFSKNVIASFKMKINFNGNWGGFSIRGSNEAMAIYSEPCYAFIVKEDIIELQIYSEAYSGIYKTFPNEYLKKGQWHDVSFGAIDCGFGQLILLIVDGKIACEHMDTSNGQITTKGAIKFHMAGSGKNNPGGQSMEIKGADSLPEGFEEIIARNKIVALNNLGADMDKQSDASAIIISKSSDNVRYNGKFTNLKNGKPIVNGERVLLNTEDLNNVFGLTTDYDKISGKITFTRGSDIITTTVGSNQYNFNGVVETGVVITEMHEGMPVVAVCEFAPAFGLCVDNYDDLIVISDGATVQLVNCMNLTQSLINAMKVLDGIKLDV